VVGTVSEANSLGVGIANLLTEIAGAFYWPPLAENALTEVPRRAPALIERLRASTDCSIADIA
jgi:hypothetical protein